MTSDISFENEFEKAVTHEQAKALTSYHKVFSIDGEIAKKEEFANNELVNVIYYISGMETEQQVLSSLVSAYQPKHGFEIRFTEKFGSNNKVTCKVYTPSGEYDDYITILLYDQQNRLIYERIESMFNNVLEIDTRKYFYNGDDEEFIFIYYDSGALAGVSGKESPFVPENDHFVSVNEFPLFFPGFLEAYTYYLNSEI